MKIMLHIHSDKFQNCHKLEYDWCVLFVNSCSNYICSNSYQDKNGLFLIKLSCSWQEFHNYPKKEKNVWYNLTTDIIWFRSTSYTAYIKFKFSYKKDFCNSGYFVWEDLKNYTKKKLCSEYANLFQLTCYEV